MAVPQRRISKTRKRLRRTHFKLTVSGLIECPHCGEMISSHKVCPFCGYYDGKQIVLTKADKKKAIEAAKSKAKASKNEEKSAKKKEEKVEKVEEVKPTEKKETK